MQTFEEIFVKRLFLLALIYTLIATTSAMAASVRATFEIGYESGIFSNSPNEETRKKVSPTAKIEVWKSYVGRQDTSTIRMIESKRDELAKRMDDIVTNLEFIDVQVDKDSRKMKFTVRAVVNDNVLSTLLAAGGAKSGEGSAFGFLILPRIQAEAKSFDATVVKKGTASASMESEKVEAEQLRDSNGGVTERRIQGEKVTLSAKEKTSGSTTRKSQNVTWAIGDAKDVDANISKYLTEAGYETSAYADVAAECGSVKTAEVRADLLASETAELSDEIRKMVFDAMRKCEQKFFAIGTLDFDSIERDRNSGGVRARAVVNVQVYELSRRIPRKVASVGPVDYYGIGPREDGARSDALKQSAKEAAQQIVNQLRSKDLN
jgi:hypothetical protein